MVCDTQLVLRVYTPRQAPLQGSTFRSHVRSPGPGLAFQVGVGDRGMDTPDLYRDARFWLRFIVYATTGTVAGLRCRCTLVCERWLGAGEEGYGGNKRDARPETRGCLHNPRNCDKLKSRLRSRNYCIVLVALPRGAWAAELRSALARWERVHHKQEACFALFFMKQYNDICRRKINKLKVFPPIARNKSPTRSVVAIQRPTHSSRICGEHEN